MKASVLRRFAYFASLLCAFIPLRSAGVAQQPNSSAGKLKIYFIDVEGGQATLFVTPTGQSLLIDTGWNGRGGRDAERIVTVAKSAGIKRID